MKTLNHYIFEKLIINKDIKVSKTLSRDEIKEIIKDFLNGTGYVINDKFRDVGTHDGKVVFTVSDEISFRENKSKYDAIEFNKLKNVAFDYIKHLHLICGNKINNLTNGFNDLCPIDEIRVLDIYEFNDDLKKVDLSNDFKDINIHKLLITVEKLKYETSIKFPNNKINEIALSIRHYELQNDFDIKNISNANCNELWLNDICLKERDIEDYKTLLKNNPNANHIYITHLDKKAKIDMYEIILKNDEIKFKKVKQQYV